MSKEGLILLPAFLHVALVFVTAIRMGGGRVGAVRSGAVKLADVALDNSRWPDRLRQLGNNYQSQFELPVLYYTVLALIIATGLSDGVLIALSFLFVASRFAHSYIHTGSNIVLRRFQAFALGATLLALMWLWFAIRLYVTG